eukprot:CAMPEP_0178943454 /NCGR_PEP_ID=MMETSP0789-20121207/2596_1 /TAXON_ID=3005 /ORGANISM="Rhizosolenia setigera, Strain CCMP 1694" /LENGTH=349 /DNA_ID=CAMNT_0020623051 /DNA_START=66 /DNA_END=1115 /DNA_ORIENTATION=+
MIAVTSNDVLCGRGGATNNHSGNRKFRKLVASHQEVYLNAKKRDKKTIANLIVERIKQDGGRFLKREEVGGVQSWVEVPSKKACEKTSQALREGLEVRRAQAAKEQQLRMANGNTAVGAGVGVAPHVPLPAVPTTGVVGEPGKQHLIPQPPQVPNSSSHHLAAQHPNNMMYSHPHQPHHAHVQHYSPHPSSSAGGSTYTPHFTQQGQAPPPGSVHSNIYHNVGNPNDNNSSKAPNLPPQSLPPSHHHHQMNIPVKNSENVAAVPPQGAEPGIPQSNSNNKFQPPQTNKNEPSRNNSNIAPPVASSSTKPEEEVKTKIKQEEFKQEQQQGVEKVDGDTKRKEETSTITQV